MNRPTFTIAFWLDMGERALKTFCQTIVALASADQVIKLDLDWGDTFKTAGIAAGLSVATSLASSLKGGTESPASLVANRNPPAG